MNNQMIIENKGVINSIKELIQKIESNLENLDSKKYGG